MTGIQYGPVGVSTPSNSWGRGFRNVLILPAVSAGEPVVRVVPSSYVEQLVLVTATLTTSIAVADRYLTLDVVQGDGLVLGRFPSRTAIAASSDGLVTWAIGANVADAAGGAAEVVPLPDLLMDPSWQWQVTAIGLDVADQVSGVRAVVNEIPTGPTGPPMGTQALSASDGLYTGGVDVEVAISQ